MSRKIGEQLRIARKNKSLSIQYVSEYLIKKGFKASPKTVYSWESGNSEPTPDALLSLCELYDISNVLDTFGYKPQGISVSEEELHYVEKIRSLDKYGYTAVMETINREFQRCTEQNRKNAEELA